MDSTEALGELKTIALTDSSQFLESASLMLLNDQALSIVKLVQSDLELLTNQVGMRTEKQTLMATERAVQSLDSLASCANVDAATLDCVAGLKRELHRVRAVAKFAAESADSSFKEDFFNVMESKVLKPTAPITLTQSASASQSNPLYDTGKVEILKKIACLRRVKRNSIDQTASIPVQVRAQLRWNKLRTIVLDGTLHTFSN